MARPVGCIHYFGLATLTGIPTQSVPGVGRQKDWAPGRESIAEKRLLHPKKGQSKTCHSWWLTQRWSTPIGLLLQRPGIVATTAVETATLKYQLQACAPRNVRILPPISKRFDRSRSPRPDFAKTYGCPAHRTPCRNTDEFPGPGPAALIGPFNATNGKGLSFAELRTHSSGSGLF
jgi:hypothetical protein